MNHYLPTLLGHIDHFMQDNAPAHTSKATKALLQQLEKDHKIETIPWPPQSPDSTPCDFSLWSVVKDRVKQFSGTDLELKVKIVQAMKTLNDDSPDYFSKRVEKEFLRRLKLCISAEGDDFEC